VITHYNNYFKQTEIIMSHSNSQANIALLVNIEAKPEHVADVEALLTGAIELANQEAGTTTWYAFKLTKTRFGIFDTFANEEGRQAHLSGDIANALLGKADEWLSQAPDILMADVLAAKLTNS
jgi:quinol monooxygenase YgiN